IGTHQDFHPCPVAVARNRTPLILIRASCPVCEAALSIWFALCCNHPCPAAKRLKLAAIGLIMLLVAGCHINAVKCKAPGSYWLAPRPQSRSACLPENREKRIVPHPNTI